MNGFRRRMTYRRKTIITTIGIVFLSLLISGIYFTATYHKTMQDIANSQLENSLDNAAKDFENILSSVNNTSFSFTATPSVREWVNDGIGFSDNNAAALLHLSKMRSDIEHSLMFNDAWMSKYIDQIYIYENGEFLSHISRMPVSLAAGNAYYNRIYESSKNIRAMTGYFLFDGESSPIYKIHHINNISRDKQLTFIYSLNMDSFSQALKGLDEDITVNLIYQGSVIWSNDLRMVGIQPNGMGGVAAKPAPNGQSAADYGEEHIMAYRFLDQNAFTVQIIAPNSIITDQILPSVITYLLVMAALTILFTIVAGITVSTHSKFLRSLVEGLEKAEQENYDITLPAYKEADLNSISGAFNSMTAAIKTLIDTVYKSELAHKEMELKQLQSQMNPHFLMNTLTTISTLALLEKKQNLHKIATSLSNLMAARLYDSNGNNLFITVGKELEYLECYLYLQEIRFHEKLSYSISLESEELRGLFIPKLSIEPIVENAVIHGIENLADSGRVDIEVYIDGEDLVILVSDNGVGFDVGQILGPETEQADGHIGIRNTNKRIHLLFGEKYGISYDSAREKGTKAFITLPVVASLEEGIANAKSNNS